VGPRRKGATRTESERISGVSGTLAPPSGARLEEPGEAEVSSARARLLDDVPTIWLDQLLVTVLDLPVQSGERAVMEAMVNSLATILPAYAIGAFFVIEPATGRREPVVIRRVPVTMRERSVGMDPTRVFPGLPYEYVVAIPGHDGWTLHLGTEDHEIDADGSPAAHLLERAGMVLGRALPGARAAAASSAQRGASALDQRMIHADKLATFGQVAAGVVHELNNPLTSIVAYSDYLIRKAIEGGGREADDVERLRRISEAANRMLRFTRELVNYARPSSGVPVPVPLASVIDRAIAFCEHVLAGAGMRVERTYSLTPVVVDAVSEQLVQVFVNLITNACQAAPSSDGCLLVSTSLQTGVESGSVRGFIVIEDNGSGIAAEHLPHVFVPFFTTKAESNGTGLGLSIVKSIIQNHGGDIRVESQRGRGTRFIIELSAR
jgi:two-component system, NtrC family, sensor kinase